MRISGIAVFVLTSSALCGATLGTVSFDYFPAPIRSYLTSRLANANPASNQPVSPHPNKNAPEPAIKRTPTPQTNKNAPEPEIKSTGTPQISNATPEPEIKSNPTPQPSKAAPKSADIDKKEAPLHSQDDTKEQPKRAKFRGISLGMTQSEIAETLPREFTLQELRLSDKDQRNAPEGRLTTSRVAFIVRNGILRDSYTKQAYGSRRDGSISFDSNQRANRLELRPSFFDVQRDTGWGKFREFLEEKYNVTWKEELERTREPLGIGGYKETRRAWGKLETGERIESTHQRIISEPPGTLESFKVQITPPLPKL